MTIQWVLLGVGTFHDTTNVISWKLAHMVWLPDMKMILSGNQSFTRHCYERGNGQVAFIPFGYPLLNSSDGVEEVNRQALSRCAFFKAYEISVFACSR